MNDPFRLNPELKQRRDSFATTDDPSSDGNLSSKPTKQKRVTLGKCFGALIAVVVIVIGAGFVIQPYLTPKVDPNLTAPVAIEASDESASEAEELAGIPAHAITRKITQKIIDEAEHPLIPLLEIARSGLQEVDENVKDYSATIVSQVRVGDVLGEEKYLFCKIRHERKRGDDTIPLSIYTRFLKPESAAGQEAIWVDGWNKDKIVAHGNGLLNVKKVYLNQEGPIAMRGNRYPIRMLGMKNLIKQLIEKGERDLKYGECTALVKRGASVDGHKCTLLEITHPEPRDHFEFHIARIYFDDERNLPLAYEGFLWPEKKGDPPLLLEKYFYTDVKLNIGLRNRDFSSKNKEYSYPRW